MAGTVTFIDEITIDGLSDVTSTILNELMYNDNLTVDITGVKRVDIAAIQMLIAAKKECEAKGKGLVLKISDEISEMLSANGLKL